MRTISAISWAQPAAVIRTSRGTGGPPRGTARARSPGRDRRCSRRSPPYAHGLTHDVLFRLGWLELLGVVGPDDDVAAAHERDAQREERQDQEQHPHVSHGSPRLVFAGTRALGP